MRSDPRMVQSCLPMSSLPSCPCFSGLAIRALQMTFNKALWKSVWPFPFRNHVSVSQDLHWETWELALGNTKVEIFFSWWGLLPFFLQFLLRFLSSPKRPWMLADSMEELGIPCSSLQCQTELFPRCYETLQWGHNRKHNHHQQVKHRRSFLF